jgi:hypothetical protein
MTRYRTAENRIDGAALGGLLAAYAVVFGLFAVWFYPLLHARQNPNPGLSAYEPPPKTVVDYTTARLPAQQAPPLTEIERRPVEPKTSVSPASEQPTNVVDHQPERIIDVKKPKRPKAPTHPSERDNPLGGYAAAYSGYSGGGSGSAASYPGYSGGRPF